jgi:hypothetical protein
MLKRIGQTKKKLTHKYYLQQTPSLRLNILRKILIIYLQQTPSLHPNILRKKYFFFTTNPLPPSEYFEEKFLFFIYNKPPPST